MPFRASPTASTYTAATDSLVKEMALAQFIQLTITPCLLVSAIGLLLLSMTNRYVSGWAHLDKINIYGHEEKWANVATQHSLMTNAHTIKTTQIRVAGTRTSRTALG